MILVATNRAANHCKEREKGGRGKDAVAVGVVEHWRVVDSDVGIWVAMQIKVGCRYLKRLAPLRAERKGKDSRSTRVRA